MGKQFHIKLKDGNIIPVTEEIYREYKRPEWREKKRMIARNQKEISFDLLQEVGYEIIGEKPTVEETVIMNIAKLKLREAISSLSETDRFILYELFYQGHSLRYVAQILEINHNAVVKRRDRILKKLRKFF